MIRAAFVATAAFGLGLAAVMMGFPDAYVRFFGFDANSGAEAIVQRAAPLVAGFSVVLFGARSLGPGPIRTAIATGVAFAWFGIAGNTLAVIVGQGATPGRVGALIFEGLIGAVFAAISFSKR